LGSQRRKQLHIWRRNFLPGLSTAIPETYQCPDRYHEAVAGISYDCAVGVDERNGDVTPACSDSLGQG
ncbi:MAG: hypothetical protein WA477_19640, partial [Candidatus Sulfotelmatobacter sp.]